MTDNPPPYPGINPNYQPSPTQAQAGAWGGSSGPQQNGYGFQPSAPNMGFNVPPSTYYPAHLYPNHN